MAIGSGNVAYLPKLVWSVCLRKLVPFLAASHISIENSQTASLKLF